MYHEKVKGLNNTVKYLKRLKYGHVDKNYDYLIGAARAHVDVVKEEQQQKELLKLYRGGANLALPATPEEKAKMPCFALRDGKPCPRGATCPYSHDNAVIEAAKAAKA